MNSKEYRIVKGDLRAAKDSNQISGYAAVFNTVTDLGYFREKISPGAFKRALSENQDIRALFNHDPNNVLGRTKSGTLTLEEDNTGLRFVVNPMPDTTVGRDVREMIMRGDVDQCSFGFVVTQESVEYDANNVATRTITDCDLFDVSTVTYPAYPTTSVQARSIEDTAKLLKRDAQDSDPDADACGCDCRACYDGECNECDLHMQSCGDTDNCDGDTDEDSDERSSKVRTKRVDGEDLPASNFLYVGDPAKTATWSLPVKFSTEEKTKSHIQNALARFSQTSNIPADKKPEVHTKLVALAKEHGIHVAGEDEKNSLDNAKRRTYLASLQ